MMLTTPRGLSALCALSGDMRTCLNLKKSAHPGDGRHKQRLDADARIVHLLLCKAWVDHIDDAVDGERRLRNVRGHLQQKAAQSTKCVFAANVCKAHTPNS